jgi:hypothetical protein
MSGKECLTYTLNGNEESSTLTRCAREGKNAVPSLANMMQVTANGAEPEYENAEGVEHVSPGQRPVAVDSGQASSPVGAEQHAMFP